MIRTILIATAAFALAAAGSASATEIVKVSLHGKTEAAIKAELADAAKAVCRGAPAYIDHNAYADYDACVEESYANALANFEKAKAAKLASLVF